MTKIQRLEERVSKDDEMCRRINEALDSIDFKAGSLPRAIGAIESIMERAGRREAFQREDNERARKAG